MYYFMGYELMNLTENDQKDKADSTFLLALDGDVDFEPKAVILLLDRMRGDNIVGAVCGRIHPRGAGKYKWATVGYKILFSFQIKLYFLGTLTHRILRSPTL